MKMGEAWGFQGHESNVRVHAKGVAVEGGEWLVTWRAAYVGVMSHLQNESCLVFE